jgi:hypothetical protein
MKNSHSPVVDATASHQSEQQLIPALITMPNKEKELAVASLATKSTRSHLIYGVLRFTLLPHLRIRPPEYHESEDEDDAELDLVAAICVLPPGINAIRHKGP